MLSGGVGIGLEISTNITVKEPINQLIDVTSSTVDFTRPVTTVDIEGASINGYANAGIGISCDANKGKLKSFQVGSIGGGFYFEESIAITTGEVTEFLYNTPSFIMNQICSNSGMNKFVKFDYIELDGK